MLPSLAELTKEVRLCHPLSRLRVSEQEGVWLLQVIKKTKTKTKTKTKQRAGAAGLRSGTRGVSAWAQQRQPNAQPSCHGPVLGPTLGPEPRRQAGRLPAAAARPL